MKHYNIKYLNGTSLPEAVGRLRYEQYIVNQGKHYPTANHASKVLIDDVDAVSVHMVCESRDNAVLSSLRLTPMGTALNLDFFDPLLAQIKDRDRFSVVLSRLVRADSLDGARSVQHIFKFCFDYCLKQDWTRGLLHTSPVLKPLFTKYGWRQVGTEYDDRYAGRQIILSLDALDLDYLSEIKSPYLKSGARNGVLSNA